MNTNGKIRTNRYTIIELLVVIVVMAILMGIGMSAVNGLLGRQGASGAVRTISSKMNLARSYAVSKNRYVAMMIPDYQTNSSPNHPSSALTSAVAGAQEKYLYSKTRICFVTENTTTANTYDFDSWIDGQEWQDLPSSTAAYISLGASTIQTVDIEGTSESVAGIVYNPSGALAALTQATIKIFRARYDTASDRMVYQGKETVNKGWDIIINGFTGRPKYEKR